MRDWIPGEGRPPDYGWSGTGTIGRFFFALKSALSAFWDFRAVGSRVDRSPATLVRLPSDVAAMLPKRPVPHAEG